MQVPPRKTAALALVLALVLVGACGASQPKPKPSQGHSPTPAAKTLPVLHGALVGHDGKPMPMAHVTIAGKATQVESDGSFRIEVAKPGLVRADFTGVDHGDHSASLLMEGGEVELLVKLGTYAAPESLSGLTVVQIRFGDEGDITLGEESPMTGEKDGKFRATVTTKAGEFAYEIRGATIDSGRSMNGSARTAFRYDGDGNYCNLVESEGGTLVIEHDPSQRHPAGVATQLAFGDPQSTTARVAAIFGATRDKAASDEEIAEIQAEHESVIRHARSIAVFSGPVSEDDASPALIALAKATITEIPVDSSLWAAAPGSVVSMASLAGVESADQVDGLIQRFVAEEEIETASEIALGLLMGAAQRADEEALKRYYSLFSSGALAKGAAAQIAKMFDPQRKVRLGRALPDFALQSMDKPESFDNQTFAGKVLLVDFWATWCKPCMEEQPNLHATYRELHDQGFEILSINVDDKPGKAEALRKGKQFPMPWSNVVLDRLEGAAVKRAFEVFGLPTMILVGRDGVIQATDMSLRGSFLRNQVMAALQTRSAK